MRSSVPPGLITLALAFLLGVGLLQSQAQLPAMWWCILLPAFFWAPFPRLKIPLIFLVLGFCWSLLRAHHALSFGVPSDLEGQDLTISGRVTSLPEPTRIGGKNGWRFEFQTEALEHQGKTHRLGTIRINWRTPTEPQAGARWQFTVRLKRPHGTANPGGFDYEKWLYQQGIRAGGYVVDGSAAKELSAPAWRINALRQQLRQRIQQAIAPYPLAGVVTALAIGARDGMTDQQWQVFNRTGTGHLIAISGLHITLIAGVGFYLGRRLWSRIARAPLTLPAQTAAAICGWLLALMYAALAGLEIPAQRTVIMLGIIFLSASGVWRMSRPQAWSLALLAVLLYDPAAVLSAGFWLSFVAVGILFYVLPTPTGNQPRRGFWWDFGIVHIAMAIGLAPLLMLLFGQNPLLGPLANFFAVPWVSFIVVPIILLGLFFTVLAPLLGGFVGFWFLRAAEAALGWLWLALHPLAGQSLSVWHNPPPHTLALICAAVGVALLLMPRGLPARGLGVLWLLPMTFNPPVPVAAGEFKFTLLDVGQGLAAVVQTRAHTLVFDTGPGFDDEHDTGKSVVLPFLRHAGVRKIDALIISHGDRDHIGGARSVLAEMPVTQIFSSADAAAKKILAPVQDRTQLCQRGQHWQWDGVNFTVLHPQAGRALRDEKTSDNNGSCVLRVSNGKRAVLLSADIEAAAEHALLRHITDPKQMQAGGVVIKTPALHADVLVAPHHGSKTSSTPRFIRAVNPQYVLYPVGYRNRYRFPAHKIRQRYQALGAREYSTDSSGAITWSSDMEKSDTGGQAAPESYRDTHRRYWHTR